MHEFGPEELVLLDRDESGLHSTQLSIWNQGLLKTRNMMLCDIRDEAALDAVFAENQPDVVFHAAALKHLRGTGHELITSVAVPAVDPVQLGDIDGSDPDEMAKLTAQRASLPLGTTAAPPTRPKLSAVV